MPSELDLAIDATISRLMEGEGPLAISHVEKFGVQLPAFSKAPGNLADYFAYFCAMNADKEFLVDGTCRLTFRECYAAARELAGGLVEGRGVRKGDRIGLAARNSANWIIAYMAIIMAGGVATLLNGWCRAANWPKASAWSGAVTCWLTHSERHGWKVKIWAMPRFLFSAMTVCHSTDCRHWFRKAATRRRRFRLSIRWTMPRSSTHRDQPASRKARCRTTAPSCRER